jgi:hypothetical protein
LDVALGDYTGMSDDTFAAVNHDIPQGGNFPRAQYAKAIFLQDTQQFGRVHPGSSIGDDHANAIVPRRQRSHARRGVIGLVDGSRGFHSRHDTLNPRPVGDRMAGPRFQRER